MGNIKQSNVKNYIKNHITFLMTWSILKIFLFKLTKNRLEIEK